VKTIGLILCILLICCNLPAQDAQRNEESDTEAYEPYAADEFPSWLHEVRRAEVILIGSFPITMLFTSLSYEGIRAVVNAVKGVETAGTQTFGGSEFTAEESRGILITGVLLSAAVAVADYILGLAGRTDGE